MSVSFHDDEPTVLDIDDVPIVVRRARVEDAESFDAHVRRNAEDPEGFSPVAPSEVRDLEQHRALIEEWAADPRVLMFVAARGEEVVGELNLRLFSRHASAAHVRVLGIGLDRSVRRRGLGTHMIERAVAWARAHAVTRIELQVFAHNAAAIALYAKMGFVVEGRRRDAFVLDGHARDDLLMALLLHPKG